MHVRWLAASYRLASSCPVGVGGPKEVHAVMLQQGPKPKGNREGWQECTDTVLVCLHPRQFLATSTRRRWFFETALAALLLPKSDIKIQFEAQACPGPIMTPSHWPVDVAALAVQGCNWMPPVKAQKDWLRFNSLEPLTARKWPKSLATRSRSHCTVQPFIRMFDKRAKASTYTSLPVSNASSVEAGHSVP